MTMTWYVVQTNRNKERLAQAAVARWGVATYLPRIHQWPPPAVGSAVAPLFPGYLFVAPDAEQCARVAATPGVRAFVAFGGYPAAIEDGALEFLRSREGSDGLIRVADAEDRPREVRIVNGPFRGLTAVVERRLPAQERVRVLMQVLRQDTPVELPERWVRSA
jgi:transcriptional antiterminator RfaH